MEQSEQRYVEYFKINMTTGEVIDTLLIDVNNEKVPEDCKEGWGESASYHKPLWDFELNEWKEGEAIENILAPFIEERIAFLNNECQQVIQLGFIHDNDVFQFNEMDQANFNQQLSLLLLDPSIDSIVWKTENNGVKLFNRNQFIEICKAGEGHKRSWIAQYWTLKEYLLSTTFERLEDINSININTNINIKVDVNG